jgi:hypothetical protein
MSPNGGGGDAEYELMSTAVQMEPSTTVQMTVDIYYLVYLISLTSRFGNLYYCTEHYERMRCCALSLNVPDNLSPFPCSSKSFFHYNNKTQNVLEYFKYCNVKIKLPFTKKR